MLTPVVTERHRLSPYAFQYETTDIPIGFTLAEWRAITAPKKPRGWWRWLLGGGWKS